MGTLETISQVQTKPKAVIFDLYRTLVHLPESGPEREFYKALGLAPSQTKRAHELALTTNTSNLADFVDVLAEMNRRDLARLDAENVSDETRVTLQYPTQLNAVNMDYFVDAFVNHVRSAELFDETKGVLEDLKNENIKLGLVSNVGASYTAALLSHELASSFDSIVLSCAMGAQKPQDVMYQRALRDLDVSAKDAIMIGNNYEQDVTKPRQLGMQAFHVHRVPDAKRYEGSMPDLNQVRDLAYLPD